MTVEELQHEQDRLTPKDDLRPYAGQWVALRDGHVVAAALSGVALRDDPDVQDDDVFLRVPAHPDSIYVL